MWAGITVVDEAGYITYQTQSVERLFGHESEELLGVEVLSIVHSDDHERVREALTGVATDGPDAVAGVEYRRRHDDGSVAPGDDGQYVLSAEAD